MSEEQNSPPAKRIGLLGALGWGAALDIYIYMKYGSTDFAHVMEFLLPLFFLFLASLYNSSIRPGARRPAPRRATKSKA